LKRDPRSDEANAFLEGGLTNDPDNAYLLYLRATHVTRAADAKRSPSP